MLLSEERKHALELKFTLVELRLVFLTAMILTLTLFLTATLILTLTRIPRHFYLLRGMTAAEEMDIDPSQLTQRTQHTQHSGSPTSPTEASPRHEHGAGETATSRADEVSVDLSILTVWSVP